ncbi:carbohydrate ABC transporter permease [Clostridium lacusfryxellense]|uniref:carbohydrate ABC transporter permease n=1 Tax=Clostridium lacusfryxellense TaxID=205328 RepID=UPI001C0CF955|nr:carbohydrate ABC transporter permease [Clostridium lacusfryxellense]MBU3113167.1 carbohydrate ABC transporter permease [Clostridium lacusfryxellense]
MILGKNDKIFDILIYTIIAIVVFLCIMPFIHILALSFSSSGAVIAQKVTLFPVGFNFEAYIRVFTDQTMIHSLFLTIGITIAFTVLGMFLIICAAYPLTKKRLKGRKIMSMLCIFTLYFSGGLIPNYLLISKLNLMNSLWSLILPLAFSAFNMIILKNFFVAIPESLEESAHLDGCSDVGILLKIVLPLSTPALATLALFYAVGRWNTFQDALFYITKPTLYPLQLKLNMIVSASASSESFGESGNGAQLVPEVLKSASVIFATVPILIIYPFLQKYFVSGVMVGAVKG